MALISIRDYLPPYDVISIELKKGSGKIPSGEYSDSTRFRIYNHFSPASGESAVNDVRINFSISPTALSSGLMNTGNPPPLLLTQVGSGVGSVVNSTIVSDEKALGLNSNTNTWQWFSLTTDGYGSSGSADGAIQPRGWCEFKLRILVPANAQTMDWTVYLYLQRD